MRAHLTKEDCNGEIPSFSCKSEKHVKGRMCNMQDFVEECIVTFCDLSGIDRKRLKKSPTPFIDEGKDPGPHEDSSSQVEENSAKSSSRVEDTPDRLRILKRVYAG